MIIPFSFVVEQLDGLTSTISAVRLLGPKSSAWQNIPVTADDFEESVMKACDLIRKNDARIGKVPKSKKVKRIRKR